MIPIKKYKYTSCCTRVDACHSNPCHATSYPDKIRKENIVR